jgi:hypothetical protein
LPSPFAVLIPDGREDGEFRLAGLTRDDLENVSIRLDESVFRHASDFQTYAQDGTRQAATVEALLNPDGTLRERQVLVSRREEDSSWRPPSDAVYLAVALILAASGALVFYRLRQMERP